MTNQDEIAEPTAEQPDPQKSRNISLANASNKLDIPRRSLMLSGLAALSAGIVPMGAAANEDNDDADVIIENAEVRTVDKDDSVVEALAIKDGQIIDVGSNEDVRPLEGEETDVLNLEGKTVIPGIQDSHIHFPGMGIDLEHVAELSFAETQEEIIEELHGFVDEQGLEEGEWIRGTRWDEYKYPDGMVTRWQLDEEFPDNPVYLTRSYRGLAVNTEVFERMGIHDDDPDTWPEWWTEDPDDFTYVGDRIRREEREIETADGETIVEEVPTGVFHGINYPDIEGPPDPDMSVVESIERGVEEMLSQGVTSIVDTSAWHGTDFREAQEANALHPLRVTLYHGSFRSFRPVPGSGSEHPPSVIDELLTEAEDEGYRGSDRWLRHEGVKFHHDGGTRSGALSESYVDWEDREGDPNFGHLHDRDEYREAMMRVPFEKGWSLHSHGVGDVAMRQITDIFMKFMDERWAEDPDADLRWSIEHALLPLEEKTRVLEDMAEYDIIASVQPNFNWQMGDAFLANFGEERLDRLIPVKSYLDAGVKVASGSDYGVHHHSPGLQLYGMLERKTQGAGHLHGPEEHVSVDDALRTMTYDGAYLTHQEDIRGSLEEGKLADLVVLDIESLDKFEEDPSLTFDWQDKVLWTLVEGETGYQAEDFPASEEDPDF